MAEKTVAVSRERIRTCLDSLLPLFKIKSLTENQFESIYSFICGREVYISLPTGSGKSVIFSPYSAGSYMDVSQLKFNTI